MSTSSYPAIDLRNAFGGGQALAGIHLTADAGLAVGRLGPGSAGQNGLMRNSALLTPDVGRFRVAGHYTVRRAAVAFLAAHPQRWDMPPAHARRRGR